MTNNAAWIRVDCASPLDHKFDLLASRLSRVTSRGDTCVTSRVEAFGLCVAVWCAMGFHAPDGDIRGVPDDVIERWAGWAGMPGAFAPMFREMFAQDGVVQAFTARQQKLADRRDHARARQQKHRARLRDVAPDVTRDTSVTSRPRDETRRDVVKQEQKHGQDGDFSAAWAAYPKGKNDNRKKAERAYRATLGRGHAPADLLAGVQRYAAYLAVTTWRQPMHAATFFGPDEHWALPWEPEPETGKAGGFEVTPDLMRDLGLDPVYEAEQAEWLRQRAAIVGPITAGPIL